MSWQSEAFDKAFNVEQDQDLEEDFKDTESPPVQRRYRKMPLNDVGKLRRKHVYSMY